MNGYLKISFVFSVLLHLILFSSVLFVSVEPKHYISFSSVYQVKLMELPKSPVPAVPKPTQKTKVKTKQPAKLAPKPINLPKPQPKPTLTPTPKPKSEVKSRLQSKAPKRAIPLKKSKRKVSQTKPQRPNTDVIQPKVVQKRIEEIARELERRQKEKRLKQEVAQIASEIKEGLQGGVIEGYSTSAPSEGSPDTKVGLVFKIYYAEVWEKIKSNWVLPTFLLKEPKELEAVVVIKVKKDGHIVEKDFEKRSGNKLFDQSVMEALDKANPLPPLPPDYIQPYHQIGIRFRWTKGGQEIL